MDVAIRTHSLTKHYGQVVGIEDLDLEVPANVVFGYLGPNGAGKTTTIRLLAGLMRPTHGRAEVLGLDSVADADALQARIGYLPGDFAAYPDLTGAQYLRFLGNLRGIRDPSSAELLAKRLELDLSRRIATLSHGNRQKVGLVQAFMHDPALLVLDEPTAGLDPLIQQEFLTLVREARDAGKTVLLSSHILDEVDAVADVVAILREGQLVVVETVAALKAQAVRRVHLTFLGIPPANQLRTASGVREVHVTGHVASVVVEGSTAELLEIAAPHRVTDIATPEIGLEQIFLDYYTSGA